MIDVAAADDDTAFAFQAAYGCAATWTCARNSSR
ncbi:DUF6207 family protein [Streptomyces lancefieldiae]|uniref:DUF6207 family protein n=1 Tax=Streptomyces lancefieldiae TaxID=3075520 RepID=A0ABU3B278_9ACTN|nr:DUF6207 family protein [Streptomyces sp. DSM 40712]MDT0616549.1 DUF6207 family protein [Streptomyces sp. DSM 40712]